MIHVVKMVVSVLMTLTEDEEIVVARDGVDYYEVIERANNRIIQVVDAAPGMSVGMVQQTTIENLISLIAEEI